MLCGRMVKRKHKEGEIGEMPGTDASHWQDHLTMRSGAKRRRVMEKSLKRDSHNGSLLAGGIRRKPRVEVQLKTTGRIGLFDMI